MANFHPWINSSNIEIVYKDRRGGVKSSHSCLRDWISEILVLISITSCKVALVMPKLLWSYQYLIRYKYIVNLNHHPNYWANYMSLYHFLYKSTWQLMINLIKTINDWTSHLPPVPVVICYHETWVWHAATKFWILPEHFPKNGPVIRVNLDVKGGPPAHGRVALVVVPLLLHGDQEAG